MKTRILFIIIAGLCVPLSYLMAAEEKVDHLTVPLSNPGKSGHVDVGLLKGSITITGYEGNEVDITARTRIKDVSNRERKRDGTEGMFHIPISSSELQVEEKDNHVEIDVQAMKNSVDLEIKVPVNTSLTVQTVHDGEITINNVRGEIEAESVHGGITLLDVSGSVAASTTHGDVKVTMNQISPDKPMSFNTFHGDVDVTLPATLKANVRIKTTQGEVYSDFKIIKTEKPDMLTTNKDRDEDGRYRVVIEHGFYGTIAGGGPEFSFSTYHGDIFIRGAK